MYFAVYLISSKINLLVPAKWIFCLNINSMANNGIFTVEKHLVFYSKNADTNPDFFSPIKRKFDSSIDACYYANILKVFGKIYICILQVFLSKNGAYF